MTELSESIRRQYAVLARSRRTRINNFTKDLPIDWRPGQVRNPEAEGEFNTHFTEASAWELIASKLEQGHPVEAVELHTPPGAKGYVMKVDIEPGYPQLYVKLQFGPRKIICRSFHYSEWED